MHRKLTPDAVNRWFDACYGSRRGFLRTWWFRVLYHAGRYRRYRDVDWGRVKRLVFVCKGNVCRSAFAEAVAKENGLTAVSCGIEAGHDRPAYGTAIEVAGQMGFSLHEHRTTTLERLEILESDLLIAMEPWQADYLLKNGGAVSACTLLGLWGDRVTPYIHDPYGLSVDYFKNCFGYLENAVHQISQKIEKSPGN